MWARYQSKTIILLYLCISFSSPSFFIPLPTLVLGCVGFGLIKIEELWWFCFLLQMSLLIRQQRRSNLFTLFSFCSVLPCRVLSLARSLFMTSCGHKDIIYRVIKSAKYVCSITLLSSGDNNNNHHISSISVWG